MKPERDGGVDRLHLREADDLDDQADGPLLDLDAAVADLFVGQLCTQKNESCGLRWLAREFVSLCLATMGSQDDYTQVLNILGLIFACIIAVVQVIDVN